MHESPTHVRALPCTQRCIAESLSPSSPSTPYKASSLRLLHHQIHPISSFWFAGRATGTMSLSCLTCGGYGKPTSDVELEQDDSYGGGGGGAGCGPWTARCCWENRNWSGELTPPPYENLRSRSIPAKPADKKKGRRRMSEDGGGSHLLAGEAAAGPQLKRSGGMRRDWSFEDLPNRKANEGRKV